MKYQVIQSTRFRKSLKRMLSRGKDGSKLEAVAVNKTDGNGLLCSIVHTLACHGSCAGCLLFKKPAELLTGKINFIHASCSFV